MSYKERLSKIGISVLSEGLDKPSKSELSEKEYLRECLNRNPDFIQAQRDFKDRWPNKEELFPDKNLRLSKCNAQQMEYVADWFKLWWNYPGPILLGDHSEADPITQPKVSLAKDTANSWPRDGSILLRVDPSATGDEVKRAYQKIKKHFFPKRLRPEQRRLKLAIYDMYKDGKSLKTIALTVRKPRPTVYGLLDAVCKDIGEAKVKGKPMVDPDFSLNEHHSTCSQCRKGRLCRLAENQLGLHSINPIEGHVSFKEAVDYSKTQKRKLPPKIDY